MKNYVTFSDAAIAIPWEFPEILLFSKFPEELGKSPEISLIYHVKAISLSFLECVGTLANSGGRYSIYVSDVRGIVAPSPEIFGVPMGSRWPILEDANCSFVSNNNIFTILSFNTYYHNQMNKILIAAFNVTFVQSLDPVYAHS